MPSPLTSSLLVLAKMAQSDGIVDGRERVFLGEFLSLVATPAPFSDVDALLEKAREHSLAELVDAVEGYEDRFFIALRAYSMAHIDADFDVKEVSLFKNLLSKLKISKGDRRLIRRIERQLNSEHLDEPDPRLAKLYENSSFAAAER